MEKNNAIDINNNHWNLTQCVKITKHSTEIVVSVALLGKLFFENLHIHPHASTWMTRAILVKEIVPFLNASILFFELIPKTAPTKLQSSWAKSKLRTIRFLFKTAMFTCLVNMAFWNKMPMIRQMSVSEHLGSFFSRKIFAVGVLFNISRSLVIVDKIRANKILSREKAVLHSTHWMKTFLTFTQASYPLSATCVGAVNELTHASIELKHSIQKKHTHTHS
jgi:hypothetical protein